MASLMAVKSVVAGGCPGRRSFGRQRWISVSIRSPWLGCSDALATPSPTTTLASKRLLMVFPWMACLDLVLGCCLRWWVVAPEFHPCGG
jgi:hypothetical protein